MGSFATPVYLAANRVDPRYGRVVQDGKRPQELLQRACRQVNKRFSHGFQALLSYTWSHAIDDGQGTSSTRSTTQLRTLTTYNGNYAFDKGSSALDQRHRMVSSFVEQPTFIHRDGAFYKYVVNNWQLSAITTLASGRPITAQIRTTDTPVPGMAYNTSINGFGGSFRVPFWPVNSLYTPPTYRADARISKIFRLTERVRLYLNFEVFNISNTTVDTSITNQAYMEAKPCLRLRLGVRSGNGFRRIPRRHQRPPRAVERASRVRSRRHAAGSNLRTSPSRNAAKPHPPTKTPNRSDNNDLHSPTSGACER